MTAEVDLFSETAAELVFSGPDGDPFTTSLVIAEETGVQHKNVIELIRANREDFEDFGRVAFQTRPFETAGGLQNREVANLNEPQATLLITYMRNNDVVRAFKKRLVAAFFAMRQALMHRAALPQTREERFALALADAQYMLTEKDERIAELEPKAKVADKLLDAEGDLAVAEAATVLTRAGIKTGGGRLFAALEMRKWIYRAKVDGRWRVMQSAIDGGWMSVLPQSHYHPKTGVLVLDPPQPRVTPKGLQRLLTDWGGAA